MEITSKCHRDGTVTYWAVYAQAWRHHTRYVPDAEYAAMDPRERERVIAHLERSITNR